MKRTWDNTEDKVLLDAITKYGLKRGMTVASTVLNRTVSGCHSRYYKIREFNCYRGLDSVSKNVEEEIETKPVKLTFWQKLKEFLCN